MAPSNKRHPRVAPTVEGHQGQGRRFPDAGTRLGRAWQIMYDAMYANPEVWQPSIDHIDKATGTEYKGLASRTEHLIMSASARHLLADMYEHGILEKQIRRYAARGGVLAWWRLKPLDGGE